MSDRFQAAIDKSFDAGKAGFLRANAMFYPPLGAAEHIDVIAVLIDTRGDPAGEFPALDARSTDVTMRPRR